VYNPTELAQHLQYAVQYQDQTKAVRLQALTATLEQHYDYRTPNLNDLVDVEPTTLWEWMRRHWTTPPASGSGS
jgi:hypothetical protein